MQDFSLLTPTVLLLSVGFLVILACRFMRISPIIGFLLAGLLLGPHGMALIEETKTTHLLAELGVVFLLFDIGLHFSTKSAWTLRKDLFGLAPLQMFITGVILASTMKFVFGMQGDFALLAGFALALSSTAVVMQIIGDLRQNESPVGKTAKATLIFQDTLAIFLLIFADAVGSPDGVLTTMILSTLFKTILAVGIVIALGKYMLTPLLRMVTRYNDPEMFTVLGLVIVMLTAAMTDYAGLSLTLGAFLAGMVLAETPFRILLQSELRPFRSLLMAFFFISVGMMLEPSIIINDGGIVLGLLLLIVSVKAAVLGALVFIYRRPAHHAIQLAFFLAQGSEFAFVIFSMGAVSLGMGSAISQQLITAIALSMLITPILSAIAYRWSLNICDTLQGITNISDDDNPTGRQPVFIIGMNEVGKTLARAMRTHDIPYIAIEQDRTRFLEATAAGYIVAYGNPGDLRFWNTLGADRAKAICTASPSYEISKEISPVVQQLYPRLKRYVAVNDSDEAQRFMALGTVPFHNKGAPPGLEMACFLLSEFGISAAAIEDFHEEEHGAYLEVHPDPVMEEQDKRQNDPLPEKN